MNGVHDVARDQTAGREVTVVHVQTKARPLLQFFQQLAVQAGHEGVVLKVVALTRVHAPVGEAGSVVEASQFHSKVIDENGYQSHCSAEKASDSPSQNVDLVRHGAQVFNHPVQIGDVQLLLPTN